MGVKGRRRRRRRSENEGVIRRARNRKRQSCSLGGGSQVGKGRLLEWAESNSFCVKVVVDFLSIPNWRSTLKKPQNNSKQTHMHAQHTHTLTTRTHTHTPFL